MKKSYVILVLSFFVAYICSGQENIKTKTISVFKNGMGFFEKELTVDASKGTAILDNFDKLNIVSEIGGDVVFGTLWFSSVKNRLLSVDSYNKKGQEKIPSGSIPEVLKANQGKEAHFKLYNDDKTFIATIEKAGDNIILLKKGGKWLYLRPASIENLEFDGKPELEKDNETEKKVIELKFEKNSSKQPLNIMYMQKGITWTPNYLIEILDDAKARIRLRANLMNDIEDIENAGINFVVGVPSFMYSGVRSPITSNENVNSFLNNLGYSTSSPGSYRPAPFANIVTQSMDYEIADYEADIKPSGTTNEEMFLYKINNVSLKKGGRAIYDISSMTTDYENIWYVTLSPSNYSSYSGNEEKNNEVWRSIKFRNVTNIPYTTGTAFVSTVKGGVTQPVSQGELKYTPVDAWAKVRMTIAPDVSVKDSEKEIDRKKNDKKFDYWYDLITMEGTIEIKNFKDKEIKLKINRILDGDPVESSVDWTVASLLKYTNAKNKKNSVDWELKIGAGDTEKIIYTYKVYARN